MNPMSLLTLPLTVHLAAAARAGRESPSGERHERWGAMVVACLLGAAAVAVYCFR